MNIPPSISPRLTTAEKRSLELIAKRWHVSQTEAVRMLIRIAIDDTPRPVQQPARIATAVSTQGERIAA